jgi:L-alanine-DL-glutamate epimerase-like enolase superfamily enzyme
MVLESKYSYRDESYRKLTTDSDYRDGFLHVPDTPGIGIEVHEDAVKELLMPGYPSLSL